MPMPDKMPMLEAFQKLVEANQMVRSTVAVLLSDSEISKEVADAYELLFAQNETLEGSLTRILEAYCQVVDMYDEYASKVEKILEA